MIPPYTIGILCFVLSVTSILASNVALLVGPQKSLNFTFHQNLPFLGSSAPPLSFFSSRNIENGSVWFGISAKIPEPSSQYLSFGFNPNLKMSGSRVLIASAKGAGEYELTAKSSDGIHSAKESVFKNITTFVTPDGNLTFSFKVSAESYFRAASDKPLKVGVVFAGGNLKPDGSVAYHSRTGSLMLILPAHILDSKGNEVEQSPSLKIEEMDSANVSNTHTVVLVHAVFMILAWLVLTPLGSLFAAPSLRRRLTSFDTHSNPKHTRIHKLIMFLVTLLVFVALILGFFVLGSRTFITHFALGVTITILLFGQVFLGAWRARLSPIANKVSPQCGYERRHLISLLHKLTGRSMWVLAAINVFIGFDIYPAFGISGTVIAGLLMVPAAVLMLTGPVHAKVTQ